MQSSGSKTIIRILIISICVLMFAGFIAYSRMNVKYPVGKGTKTEFAVTKLSLTHAIERDKNGKLVLPGADKAPGAGKACPT